jgi:membrane protein
MPTEHVLDNREEISAVRTQRALGIGRQLRGLCTLGLSRLGSLLLHAYNDWNADGAARLSAALAYYTLFSIAPVTIVVTGVASLFLGQAAARGLIAPWLERLLSPSGAQAAELMLKQTATLSAGVAAMTLGFVTLFLGTSALIAELRHSLNLIFRVTDSSQDVSVLTALRDMLSDRAYGFLIVMGAGLLIVAVLVANTAIAAAGRHFESSLPLPESVLHAVHIIVGFGPTLIMFMLIYKMVPDAHVAWGDAAVGALITTVLFTLGGQVLTIFLGKETTSIYGSAASVLAMLAWVYYSAQVFFYGAELTRIFANEYGGKIVRRRHSVRTLLRRRPPLGT